MQSNHGRTLLTWNWCFQTIVNHQINLLLLCTENSWTESELQGQNVLHPTQSMGLIFQGYSSQMKKISLVSITH